MENIAGKTNTDDEAKPVGARVNIKLWDQVRIQAIREHRRTGEVLNDAICRYLEAKNEKSG